MKALALKMNKCIGKAVLARATHMTQGQRCRDTIADLQAEISKLEEALEMGRRIERPMVGAAARAVQERKDRLIAEIHLEEAKLELEQCQAKLGNTYGLLHELMRMMATTQALQHQVQLRPEYQ